MPYETVVLTPIITPGEVYHAGMVVGGLMAFDLIENKAQGFVDNVMLFDAHPPHLGPFQVNLFDDEPSQLQDRENFVLTAEDMLKLVMSVEIGPDDYQTIGERHVVRLTPSPTCRFAIQNQHMYTYAVNMGGTPTYNTQNDLSFKIGFQIT